jgi:hypothetical protein
MKKYSACYAGKILVFNVLKILNLVLLIRSLVPKWMDFLWKVPEPCNPSMNNIHSLMGGP